MIGVEVLPSSLIHLKFGHYYNYNQAISMGVLPGSLTHLYLNVSIKIVDMSFIEIYHSGLQR
jgi:hypothetical protein